MSKSYRSKNTKFYYEDENDNYNYRSNYSERREKRVLSNALRSKNVSRLMELDNDEDDDFYIRR